MWAHGLPQKFRFLISSHQGHAASPAAPGARSRRGSIPALTRRASLLSSMATSMGGVHPLSWLHKRTHTFLALPILQDRRLITTKRFEQGDLGTVSMSPAQGVPCWVLPLQLSNPLQSTRLERRTAGLGFGASVGLARVGEKSNLQWKYRSID